MSHYKEEDGIKVPVRGSLNVETAYYRAYMSFLPFSFHFTKAQHDVWNFACTVMDTGTNHFHTGKSFVEELNLSRNRSRVKPYAETTIRNAISGIVGSGLFQKSGTRGLLIVNPLYVFRGCDADRESCIEVRMKFTNESIKLRAAFVDPEENDFELKPKIGMNFATDYYEPID